MTPSLHSKSPQMHVKRVTRPFQTNCCKIQSQFSSVLISWELNHMASLSSAVERIKSPPWCPLVSTSVPGVAVFFTLFDIFSHILSTDTTRPCDQFFLPKVCFCLESNLKFTALYYNHKNLLLSNKLIY